MQNINFNSAIKKNTEINGSTEFSSGALSNDTSDFEYALVTLMFGFNKWVETCMDAADFRGLKSLDILVLHAVNHRARCQRVTEICMVINIEDIHLVGYSLKKLTAAGLIFTHVIGRERVFETTEKGEKACLAYRKVREKFLIENLKTLGSANEKIALSKSFMNTMSMLYSQASRLATIETSMTAKSPPLHTKK